MNIFLSCSRIFRQGRRKVIIISNSPSQFSSNSASFWQTSLWENVYRLRAVEIQVGAAYSPDIRFLHIFAVANILLTERVLN